jgi:cell fate regulator YaaT (PSP1 superfamily)
MSQIYPKLATHLSQIYTIYVTKNNINFRGGVRNLSSLFRKKLDKYTVTVVVYRNYVRKHII